MGKSATDSCDAETEERGFVLDGTHSFLRSAIQAADGAPAKEHGADSCMT